MDTTKAQKQELAKNLREQMARKGWNQSELARRAGMGRDNVSCYARALTFPRDDHLRALAKALSVDVETLVPGYSSMFGEAEPPFAMTPVGGGERVHLKVNKVISTRRALRIMELLHEEDD